MMPNPFDDAAPQSARAGNPFDDAHSGAKANPFNEPGLSAGGAAPGGLDIQRWHTPNIIEALNLPGRGVRAALGGRENIEHFLDRTSGSPFHLRQPPQALKDFITDTATDPFTYAGGAPFKIAGKLLGGAGSLAGSAITHFIPESADVAAHARNAIQDFFTYGGSAKRKLGTERFHAAQAAMNRQAAKFPEAERLLHERFDSIFGGLTDVDKTTAYRILNGEESGTDPNTGRVIAPAAYQAAQQGKKLLQDAAALYATKSGRQRLAFNAGNLANEKYLPKPQPPAAAPQEEPYGLGKDEFDAFLNLHAEPKPVARPLSPMPTRSLKSGLLVNPTEDEILGARRVPPKLNVLRTLGRKYQLPPELEEFAAPNEQGLLESRDLRRDYLPGPRTEKEIAQAKTQRPQPFNLLTPFSPNVFQRERFNVTSDDDLSKFDEAFRNALSNAARQATAGRLRSEVGVSIEPGKAAQNDLAMMKLFEKTPRAEGEARTPQEKLADTWQALVNIPKNTVSTIGLKHGLVNVPALAALSEGPGAAAQAFGGGVQLARMSARARYEALRPAIEAGVISPFQERENPIAEALARIPGRVGRALGGASKASNALTWAIDDAAKKAVLEAKLARGVPVNQAAAETLRELINYGQRSRATEMANKIAPFATFRTRLPGAVASSALRDPRLLLALDRLTSGASSTGGVTVGGHNVSMSTPLSDTMELGNEPQRYIRATLADPIKAALGAAQIAMPTQNAITGQRRIEPRYFTYGESVLPHLKAGWPKAGYALSALAGDVPFGLGSRLLDLTGTGEFPAQDIVSSILGPTFGAYVR